MAADEINAAGGIKVGADNYKIDVIAYDDKANPTEATNAVRKLIDRDGVKYILGFCCSGATSAVASFIAKEKAVMLVGNAAERSITTQKIPNLVRTRPPADFTGQAAGTFIARKGHKRIAVLGALDVGFYAQYVDAAEKEIKKVGGEIITREVFSLRDRDMTPATDQDPRPQSRCHSGGRLCRTGSLRLSPGGRARDQRATVWLHQRQRGAVPARDDVRADGRGLGPSPDGADPAFRQQERVAYHANYTKRFNIAPSPSSPYAYDHSMC